MGELCADDRIIRPESNGESGSPITSTAVNHAIKKLKNNKATGTDLIAAEMLKAIDDLEQLTELCNDTIIQHRILAKRSERVNICTYHQYAKSN